MTSDLGRMTYGELVDSLRKDLLLDATTDVLPGSILSALIDQNGKAPFLQLVTAQKLRLVLGQIAVTWPGGTQYCGAVTITYNIGGLASPYIFLSATGTTSGFTPVPKVISSNANSSSIRCGASDGNPPAGEQAVVYWAVIG